MESLDRTVGAEDPRSNLQTSVAREKSKLHTLDALTRCRRCGGLGTESNGRKTFLQSARAGGNANEVLENLQMSVLGLQTVAEPHGYLHPTCLVLARTHSASLSVYSNNIHTLRSIDTNIALQLHRKFAQPEDTAQTFCYSSTILGCPSFLR